MRTIALGLALAACGGETTPARSDGPIVSGACTTETDCAAPTPYCEPTTGTCAECRFSSHCTSNNGICEGQVCRAARSCKELRTELPGLASGVYRIDLDGAGPGSAADVYCEMTVDGGGWALVQRTRWAWSASQALVTTYATWHDTTIGTPGTGTAYRMAGKQWPGLLAEGKLMISHRIRTTSGGACNPLWYIGTGASITLDPAMKIAQINTLTAPVNLTNSTLLSTSDSGADSGVCVNTNNGVPWFYGGCCTTCPTFKGGYWTDEPHPMTGYVNTTPDFFGKIETDVCANQTIRVDAISGAYRGIDTMEVYLR